MSNPTPLLSVRGLTKRFGGLTAVSDLDFDLEPGEILAIIGPNGAGKSTTFNLICGAMPPTAGTVTLEGRRIDGLQPNRIAELGIYRTFQHNMPFKGMSVTDNILVGRHARRASSLWSVLLGRASVAEAERAARDKVLDIARFVGIDTLLDADVTTLSFGQGRLLEIARALAGEPKILLLDEPAAGLTLSECARLFDLIKDVARQGISVLLIEHDMHFLLPLTDRIVVLNFGGKIAEGTSGEVRANPAVVDAYLGKLGAASENVGAFHASR
jgi:ABC-type branched-subunit amino acid transport system ATPase component